MAAGPWEARLRAREPWAARRAALILAALAALLLAEVLVLMAASEAAVPEPAVAPVAARREERGELEEAAPLLSARSEPAPR